MAWLILALALVVGYFRIGLAFRNHTAAVDAARARAEWHGSRYVRDDFINRQRISLYLWPFKAMQWASEGDREDRWREFDPVTLRERERRIDQLERELGIRRNAS